MQLQFLGRKALNPAQRNVLRNLSLLQARGMQHESWYIEQWMQDQGFSAEQVREIARDPLRWRQAFETLDPDAPEVTDALARAGAPAAVIDDVTQFEDLVSGCSTPLLLDRCELDDDGGTFQVACYQERLGLEVREGDLYYAGLSLRGDTGDGSVDVAPRMLRLVCRNGQYEVTDESGNACIYQRDADGRVVGEMGLTVEVGLSRRTLEAAIESMQVLTRRRAADPIEALERHEVRVPHWARPGVRDAFRQNGDATVYGSLQALTQTARDAGTVAKRTQLERHAGDLALLPVRPVPTS